MRLGQVAEQRGQLGTGAGQTGPGHPLAVLLRVQPARLEMGVQGRDGRVALGRPDAQVGGGVVGRAGHARKDDPTRRRGGSVIRHGSPAGSPDPGAGRAARTLGGT